MAFFIFLLTKSPLLISAKPDTEVILVFRVPASIVQNYTLPLLKSKFYNLTNSVTLPAFLNVKEINLTTGKKK